MKVQGGPRVPNPTAAQLDLAERMCDGPGPAADRVARQFADAGAKSYVYVYIEPRDWWVGYYRGDTHHYVCPLPTVVIRWPRRTR